MRHAAGAIDFVDRADLDPKHLYGRGRAVVGLDDQRHAIGQLPAVGRICGLCVRAGEQKRE